MPRKHFAILLVLTVVNVCVLVLNVLPAARAALAGARYKELIHDPDFTHAVKYVVERCRVNVDLARVLCN
jgi:hypothetical protein